MQSIVGTSGWMYRDWNDVFYPANVKGKDQLAFFATQFSTVEINSTFYHMPLETSVQHWYNATPDDFVFAIKLNRFLTHTKRLIPDEQFSEGMTQFFTSTRHLRQKFGVLLVQLPPSLRLTPERIVSLADAISKLESKFSMRIPIAIEFRHASWFTPHVRALLRELNIAQVIIDSPGRWPADKSITADFAYFRFHGSRHLYRSSYSDEELDAWAAYIKKACKNCEKVYVYFNNDYHAAAVDNARSLRQKLQ